MSEGSKLHCGLLPSKSGTRRELLVTPQPPEVLFPGYSTEVLPRGALRLHRHRPKGRTWPICSLGGVHSAQELNWGQGRGHVSGAAFPDEQTDRQTGSRGPETGRGSKQQKLRDTQRRGQEKSGPTRGQTGNGGRPVPASLWAAARSGPPPATPASTVAPRLKTRECDETVG